MYSSAQDFTADETGLLVPKDAPRVKSRRVASAALVALCFASGVAISTSAAASTRGASSLVGHDKSAANNCFNGDCGACGNRHRLDDPEIELKPGAHLLRLHQIGSRDRGLQRSLLLQ